MITWQGFLFTRLIRTENPHEGIVKIRPELADSFIRPTGMYPVGQEHNDQILVWIYPERGTGVAEVPDRTR